MCLFKTAMILGAGHGVRMRPLTNNTPKPLIKVGGRALIDHVLVRLKQAGVEKAVVNVHYSADALEHYLLQNAPLHVIISDEREALLDTGGGVKKALPYLGEEPFLIHNSDSIWIEKGRSNVSAMGEAWDAEKMDCLMLLAKTSDTIGYSGKGDFHKDERGRLTRRQTGETADFVFAGVSVARFKLFTDSPEGAFSMNFIWDKALEKGRLYGLTLDGLWMHIGTPQARAEAQNYFNLSKEL